MDNCCNTDSFVAAGIREQLHNGRVYSHPAGDCHYRGAVQHHSGAKTFGVKKVLFSQVEGLKEGAK